MVRTVSGARAFLAVVALMLSPPPADLAHAATWRWTGLDPSSSAWSRAQNWNPASVPANDGSATLIFGAIPAAARHDPTADVPWQIDSLEVGGDDPYVISGAMLSLTRGISVQNGVAVGIQYRLANDVALLADNVWSNPSPSTLVSTGDIDLGSHRLTLVPDGSNGMTVQGDISGAGSLVKVGKGPLRLAGHNTFSGGTTVSFGLLSAQAPTAIPTGPLLVKSGILDLGTTGNVVGPGPVSLDGLVIGGPGGSPVVTGNPILISTQGDWIVFDASDGTTGESLIGGTLNLDTPDGSRVLRIGDTIPTNEELSILAAIVNPSSVPGPLPALRKLGKGRIILSGLNSFRRAMDIEEGTVLLGRAEAVGATGPENPTIVRAGATAELAFNFTVLNETLRLNGAGDNGVGALSQLRLSSVWAGPVVLESDAAIGAAMPNAVLSISGVVSGPGGLTKVGPGTVTLTGSNTFAGATHVAEGTLRVDNGAGHAIPSAVTVASAATLAGDGSVGGPVTVQSGGILCPGAAGAVASSLAAQSVVFVQNATLRLTLVSNQENSRLDVASSADFDGRLEVAMTSSVAPASGNSYTLVSYASRSGQFVEVSLPPLSGGLVWTLDYGPNALIARVTSPTGVIDAPGGRVGLFAVGPNPFRIGTRLRIELARAGRVRVDVLDVEGRLVKPLVDAHRESGAFEVEWRGETVLGSRAGSGLYFVRMMVDGRAVTPVRRIVLAR